jgi:hypothetical protein
MGCEMFKGAEMFSIQVVEMFDVCLTWAASCSQSNRRQSAQPLDAFSGEHGRDALKERLLYVDEEEKNRERAKGADYMSMPVSSHVRLKFVE